MVVLIFFLFFTTMLWWKSRSILTPQGGCWEWSCRIVEHVKLQLFVVGHTRLQFYSLKWLKQHICHWWYGQLFISPQPCQCLVLWVLDVSSLVCMKCYLIISFCITLISSKVEMFYSFYMIIQVFTSRIDFFISFSLEPSEGLYQEPWPQVEEYSQLNYKPLSSLSSCYLPPYLPLSSLTKPEWKSEDAH